MAVDPANADDIFVGTEANIFASFDAGRTWAKQDAGFANTIVESMSIVRENNVSTLYALTHGRGAWAVILDGGQPAACSFQFDFNVVAAPRTGQLLIGDRVLPIPQLGAAAVAGNARPETAFEIASLPFVGTRDSRLYPAPNSEASPVDSRGSRYKFSAVYTGTLLLTAAASTSTGSPTGNVIGVYEGDPTLANEKACVRSGIQPQLRFPVQIDQRYWIQISAPGTANSGGIQIFAAARIE